MPLPHALTRHAYPRRKRRASRARASAPVRVDLAQFARDFPTTPTSALAKRYGVSPTTIARRARIGAPEGSRVQGATSTRETRRRKDAAGTRASALQLERRADLGTIPRSAV